MWLLIHRITAPVAGCEEEPNASLTFRAAVVDHVGESQVGGFDENPDFFLGFADRTVGYCFACLQVAARGQS